MPRCATQGQPLLACSQARRGLPLGPVPLRSGLPPAGERLGAAGASPTSLAATSRRWWPLTRFRPPASRPAPSRRARWGCLSTVWAWHSFAMLVPRCWQQLRARLLAATSQRRWPLPVLASWRPGRRVWCGPQSSGIARRALRWRGRGNKLSYARPCVGSPRHP